MERNYNCTLWQRRQHSSRLLLDRERPQNLLFDSLPPCARQGRWGNDRPVARGEPAVRGVGDGAGEPASRPSEPAGDILVVQAVRAHLAQSGGGCKGWLRALIDPQIGRALSLIHEKPEDDWTVESPASKFGMSRSAFAARFAQLVEEPPLTYLTRWRMQKASRLLETSQAGVAEVAKRVGYDAEAAFSKAFKRWIGVAPGAYRRTAESRGHPEIRLSGGGS